MSDSIKILDRTKSEQNEKENVQWSFFVSFSLT